MDQPDVRRSTLESLATRLNTETDAMVRRGLQESIYDLLDENTGYLTAWVRASAQDADQATTSAPATKPWCVTRPRCWPKCCARERLSAAKASSTPYGIFTSATTLCRRSKRTRSRSACPRCSPSTSAECPTSIALATSTRPIARRSTSSYDVHNGFFQTRVGNDSDLIHFFKSSGPELENALLACLQGANDTMKIEVLKAGSTLSGAGDERFTLAALNLSEDPSLEVRQTVRYVYEDGQRGILNLDAPVRARSRTW